MFKKKKENDENLMDMIPQKKIESIVNEEGKTILLRPKWQGKLGKKWIQPRLKKEKAFFRVNLDEMGAFVWNCINNKKTVYDIFKEYENNFQEEENALNRLIMFIKILTKNQFIELKSTKIETG